MHVSHETLFWEAIKAFFDYCNRDLMIPKSMRGFKYMQIAYAIFKVIKFM